MIGIDIGKHSIKVTAIKSGAGKPTVNKLISAPLPFLENGAESNGTEAAIIASLLSNIGKAENTIAMSVPISSCILKVIEVDKSAGDTEIEDEVQYIISDLVPFPVDEVYIDFVSLGATSDNDESQDILIAATKKDVVDRLISYTRSKSIKHNIVDIDAFAIGALIERMHGKENKRLYAVVDVGYQSTNIFFYANNELIFSQEQPIGGHQLTESIAENNALSLEEAEKIKCNNIDQVPQTVIDGYLDSLVEQIALTIEEFHSANNGSIKCVYLTGGGSQAPGIIKSLTENIPSQEFKNLPISDFFQIKDKNNQYTKNFINSQSGMCIGLALRT